MTRAAHILVVDDEPNVRLVFRTALEASGYKLSTAAEGKSALDLVQQDPPDLILLDLQMPGSDGMDVLRQLREGGNNVPVVIITAHGSVPHAVQAMKLGAIDFLAKPISPEALRNVVNEVIQRHAAPGKQVATAVSSGEPLTTPSQFAASLSQAKRALNQRSFQQAEAFLKQAIALKNDSAEAHNLMGVLHELRNQHDDSYREYKAALKANHRYEPAKHNMQRYYERFTFGKSDVLIDTGES
jgi:DNA-binding response OmpR family regulator